MTAPPLARYFSDVENQGRGYISPLDPNGRRYPGVTSIIKLVAKDMSQYGSDMAVRWMSQHWAEWTPGQRSEESAFRSARYRHKDYRDERGEIGTGVHSYIEDHVKGLDPIGFDLDTEQWQMIEQFDQAVFLTGMEFIDSEVTVFGEDWAGTLDLRVKAYSERLGRVVTGILDVKTSKSIYPEVMLQLAALKSARTQFRQVTAETPNAIHLPDKNRGESWWLKEDAPEVETAWALHLRGDFWDVDHMVPAKWEMIEIGTEKTGDESLHLARFEALKQVWYANDGLKKSGFDLNKRLSA